MFILFCKSYFYLLPFVFSAYCRLAANWPATMQIVRLISQDHMNNKYFELLQNIPLFLFLYLSSWKMIHTDVFLFDCVWYQAIRWEGWFFSFSSNESARVSRSVAGKEACKFSSFLTLYRLQYFQFQKPFLSWGFLLNSQKCIISID